MGEGFDIDETEGFGTLAILLAEGEAFYLNPGKPTELKCVIKQIRSSTRFKVSIDRNSMIEVYEITANVKTEISQRLNVFVSAGLRAGNKAKVVIYAPKGVKILRDKHVE